MLMKPTVADLHPFWLYLRHLASRLNHFESSMTRSDIFKRTVEPSFFKPRASPSSRPNLYPTPPLQRRRILPMLGAHPDPFAKTSAVDMRMKWHASIYCQLPPMGCLSSWQLLSNGGKKPVAQSFVKKINCP